MSSDIRRYIKIMEGIENSMPAIHRTSETCAKSIRQNGFSLDNFGNGAGAGSGEPAGIFVSLNDGADFSNENNKRNIGLNVVLRLKLHVTKILKWGANERLKMFKDVRLEFVQSKFDLSVEDANAVIRYIVRILKERPELDRIANWLDSREGERELALFFNKKLRESGYDAVEYRDPWQGVEQMIVLCPEKIELI